MKNIANKVIDSFAYSITNRLNEQVICRVTESSNINKEHPVSLLAGPNKTPVVFVHNTYGQRVFLDPADYFICIHYLEYLDWEDHLEDVYRESLLNGGVYLDIGGNIGLHVLRAHRLGASSIYAFEPNPNTFDILKLNMNLNGMHDGFYCHALGAKNGVVGMNVNDYSAGMARIEDKTDGLLEVPIKTLNHFVEDHPELESEVLSLVKIDVEGHEGEVVDGAIDFLKGHSDFNVIIEFGSFSSVYAIQTLNKHFNFKMKLYRWMRRPIDVDMEFVNDEIKRTAGDLVLFGLNKK